MYPWDIDYRIFTAGERRESPKGGSGKRREKGAGRGRQGKGEIPGNVEDAIEIKRKCESTCRRGPAFIRVLLCDSCMILPRELHPCEIEFQSLVTADTRCLLLLTAAEKKRDTRDTSHLIVRDGIIRDQRENSRGACCAARTNVAPSVISRSLNLHANPTRLTGYSLGRVFLRRARCRVLRWEAVVRPARRSP